MDCVRVGGVDGWLRCVNIKYRWLAGELKQLCWAIITKHIYGLSFREIIIPNYHVKRGRVHMALDAAVVHWEFSPSIPSTYVSNHPGKTTATHIYSRGWVSVYGAAATEHHRQEQLVGSRN